MFMLTSVIGYACYNFGVELIYEGKDWTRTAVYPFIYQKSGTYYDSVRVEIDCTDITDDILESPDLLLKIALGMLVIKGAWKPVTIALYRVCGDAELVSDFVKDARSGYYHNFKGW